MKMMKMAKVINSIQIELHAPFGSFLRSSKIMPDTLDSLVANCLRLSKACFKNFEYEGDVMHYYL